MDNKKYLPIKILNIILILAGIAANIVVALSPASNVTISVAAWLTDVALISSLVYMVFGYGKNAARFYRWFLYLFAVAELASVAGVATRVSSPIGVVCAAILFGFILVLAIAKDLGKRVSLAVCYTVLILSVLFLALAIVGNKEGVLADGIKENMGGLNLILRSASLIVLSGTMTLMTYAKYIDKAARGTK